MDRLILDNHALTRHPRPAMQVYAVEASPMADWAARLCRANPVASAVVEVLHRKVEALTLEEKVDVLISEPMGTLLVRISVPGIFNIICLVYISQVASIIGYDGFEGQRAHARELHICP